MKIDADLHAILRSTLTQGNCGCYVVVTAAVTVTVLIIGIIPDTETDIVHTGLCQRHENILFFPVEIIIFHAAVLQSQYCRGVHAPVKIIGNAVDRLHIDGRFLRPFRHGKRSDIGDTCPRRTRRFNYGICGTVALNRIIAAGQTAHNQSCAKT